MNILFLSFFFEPDLSAGSFRNSPLFKELLSRIGNDDHIHVVTTLPNRYHSYKQEAKAVEIGSNFRIDRLTLPKHKNGFADQIKSFCSYFSQTTKLVKKEKVDLVYATSSKLFTAFLGKRIAVKNHCPLYLDIRDIFVETMEDVFKHKPIIRIPACTIFKQIERYTFKNATHINLVSEGFKPYFKEYPKPTYSYFTNGIDDIFLNAKKTVVKQTNKIIITYAGNIGSGQGLEKIIPEVAAKVGDNYLFRIIGDGGTKNQLINKVNELGIKNVEIIPPVSREELIGYYNESDFLFLHLNDLEAFKRVLPSKLFEYGAFEKPIIAGVAGYAAEFTRENLKNYILFPPTNVDSMVSQLLTFKNNDAQNTQFIQKYSRKNILREMANTILALVK